MKKKIIRNINLKDVVSGALLFYIVYTPTLPESSLFNKNITIPLITLIVIIYSMVVRRGNFNIKIDKTMLVFVICLLAADIYALCVYIANNDFDFMESRIVQNLIPFCYLYLIARLFAHRTKDQIFDILVNFAVLQGAVTILMLIFPGLHNISLALYNLDNTFITSYRVYGITSDFTYATPIYHGILAAMLVYKWINKERKVNLIKLGLIILVIIMNGRTGLLVLFINVFVFIFGYIIKKGNFFRALSYMTVGALMFCVIFFIINTFLPQTSRFLTRFVNDTASYLIEGESSGNYEVLENSITVPTEQELIFGKGLRLYKQSETDLEYKKTDIGFMNDIFLGGLVYSCLMYFAYIYFAGKKIQDKAVLVALIITMIIANIKGEAFRSTILIFMFIGIPMMESKIDVVRNKDFNNDLHFR